MKSSEIIRLTLSNRFYKGWLGLSVRTGDEYMCVALTYTRALGVYQRDIERTRHHIEDALGGHTSEYSTLSGMFSAYGWSKAKVGRYCSSMRNPFLHKMAVGFFEDLADYLESIDD